MSQHIHIASFVVRTDAAHVESVCLEIELNSGASVHTRDPSGKLIVTAETETEQAIVSCLDNIQNISGVFNASLVYHHCEDASTLDEELPRNA